MSPELSFSFVIPAHNEERHIEETVRLAQRQDYSSFEIVVIDDGSTDSTISILGRLEREHVLRLVRSDQGRGPAAARNLGVDRVTGDVAVFLDADVLLPADFLRRLAALYRNGADAVAVESKVADASTAVSRFQQAVHELNYPGMRGVGFSQAFSCRRELAAEARFPEELPGCGGEDGEFFDRVKAMGSRCVQEPGIVVEHVLPTDVPSLWRQAVKRGRAAPFVDRHLRGLSLRVVIARRALSTARAVAGTVLAVPALGRAVRLARRSPEGFRDVPSFWLLHHLFLAGQKTGEWKGVLAVARERS